MQRCFQSKYLGSNYAEGLHFSAFHFCIVLLCSLHGPGPGPVLCMIRERHVILKAALHSGLYSCLAAASYIIMLYCLVYSFF